MSKIIEKNGYRYSLQEFPEYKFCYKFEIVFPDWRNNKNFDIYTENSDRNEVENMFLERALEVHPEMIEEKSGIINKSTKEQDDTAGEMINEWLNKF